MKKQILNVGKILSKAAQKSINGGGKNPCGATGGMILDNVLSQQHCALVGNIWHNGKCWACY